jgi:transcriptional regulator with XRE-family HTH domain
LQGSSDRRGEKSCGIPEDVGPQPGARDACDLFNAPGEREAGLPCAGYNQADHGGRDAKQIGKLGFRQPFLCPVLFEKFHACIVTLCNGIMQGGSAEKFTPCLWRGDPSRVKPLFVLKNRIHELRKARGLTVEELAAQADMSPSYVSLMASGARNISVSNMKKLALALRCSPLDLLTEGTPADDALLNVWASIPPERRDLALTVLQSFTNLPVDNPDERTQSLPPGTKTKKRQKRNS